MEMFIINALEQESNRVIKHFEDNPEKLNEMTFISPHAWLECAKEILEKLNAKYEHNNPEPATKKEPDNRQGSLDFGEPADDQEQEQDQEPDAEDIRKLAQAQEKTTQEKKGRRR